MRTPPFLAAAFALPLALLAAVPAAVPGAGRPPADARRGAARADTLRDLSLVELPAGANARGTLMVFISGDGGWASLDQGVARRIADSGVAVVGLNSRAYLTSAHRTPDTTAADVARILRHYMALWHCDKAIIAGYSRGAEFVPFVVPRLPDELRRATVMAVMIAPGTTASYEFHMIDIVRNVKRATDIPIKPELDRMRGLATLCVYGIEEKESLCTLADSSLVTRVPRAGGHHFDGDAAAIGDLIAHAIPR